MTKVSADADKFGATERCVHKEPSVMVSNLPDHGNSAVAVCQYQPSLTGAQSLATSLSRVGVPPGANRPVRGLVVRPVRDRFRMRDVRFPRQRRVSYGNVSRLRLASGCLDLCNSFAL